MKNLLTVAEAAALIRKGEVLLIAGEESLLRELPRGRWLGGSIPYFMTADGGVEDATRLFVTPMPAEVEAASVKFYGASELAAIPGDCPENGVSFIIIPSGSEAHTRYAKENAQWPTLFDRPLVGWVAGVALERLGTQKPVVVDGQTGLVSAEVAAVMHCALSGPHFARTEIINLFERGDGDTLVFTEDGLEARSCLVNGERRELAEYLRAKKIDTRWPLVADFGGAMINVSFQSVEADRVAFYAPVFANVEYRLARPLNDYVGAFATEVRRRAAKPIFSCNCILNYLYAELKGKRVDDAGPFTFGEIAWMLLNQTLVYVTLERAQEEVAHGPRAGGR